MIQANDLEREDVRSRAPAQAAGRPRQRRHARHGRRRLRRAGSGALIGAVLLAGCAGGHPGRAHPMPRRPGPGGAVPAAAAGSLVRVPRPDYADPASVVAAFYTAWAGVDAVHDGPLSFAARCAPLATAVPGPAAGQPGPGADRHPPQRRARPHPVGGVPAGLRQPGNRHHVRPHHRQRRRHRPAHPHGRPVAGQRRAVLVREPAVIKAVTAAGAAAVAFPLLIIVLVTASPAPPAATAAPPAWPTRRPRWPRRTSPWPG